MGHALQPWLRHLLALDSRFLIQSMIALEIAALAMLVFWPAGKTRTAASLVAIGILLLPVLAFSDNDQSTLLALFFCSLISFGLWIAIRAVRHLGVRL